jgi:cytochrome b involved in lipid metabolism
MTKLITTNKTNKTSSKGGGKTPKTYTMQEVAKHNKKTDAWLVINRKVYNVTSWIPKHPGGDVILSGVGKDATQLFNSKGGTGHSADAHKILAKYLIGTISTQL